MIGLLLGRFLQTISKQHTLRGLDERGGGAAYALFMEMEMLHNKFYKYILISFSLCLSDVLNEGALGLCGVWLLLCLVCAVSGLSSVCMVTVSAVWFMWFMCLTMGSPLRHGRGAKAVESRLTVRHREMGTGQMGTILRFASVPLRKMGTDLLGSWWP